MLTGLFRGLVFLPGVGAGLLRSVPAWAWAATVLLGGLASGLFVVDYAGAHLHIPEIGDINIAVDPSEVLIRQSDILKGSGFAPGRVAVFRVPGLAADSACPGAFDGAAGHVRVYKIDGGPVTADKVTLQSAAMLPRGASADYATQVSYNGRVLWDPVNFTASLDVVEDRVSYNRLLTVKGLGCPDGEAVRIYGVNVSREDLHSVLEEEETTDWDCRLVAELSWELGRTEARSDNGISTTIPVSDATFRRAPGKWLLHATAGAGATSGAPAPETVDYEARSQAGGRYYAGDDAYIRIVPAPAKAREPTGLIIGSDSVAIEVDGAEVHFVVPVDVGVSEKAVVAFPGDLAAELEPEAVSAALSASVAETDGKVRIGSRVKLSADNLSGERVCSLKLDDVVVAFLLGNRMAADNCVVIGANRKFPVQVLVAAPDGSVPAELVKLFDEQEGALLSLETDNGAEIVTSLVLLRPAIEVTDGDGLCIDDGVLYQFKAMQVAGKGFPRSGANFNAHTVGYEVRDNRSWNTVSSDGAWEHEFRVTGRVSEGTRLEFVPTIAGHCLPALAFVIQVGVQTPALSIDPSELSAGVEVTITAENLLGYTEGYYFAILQGEGDYYGLADYGGDKLVRGRTGRDGSFTVTFRFPDYEADFYDVDGKAVLEIQLYDSYGEAVPEALLEVTHLLRTPGTELDGGVAVVPTATPAPVATPVPLATRVPTITPAPTRNPFSWAPTGSGFSEGGLPRPVNHRWLHATAALDGWSVALDWERPGGVYRATGYTVLRYGDPAGEGEWIADLEGEDNTAFVDAGVEPAGAYWYEVVSYSDSGPAFEKDELAPVPVLTPGIPGPVPGFRGDEPGSTLVSLRWNDPVVDEGYYRPVLGYEIQSASGADGNWTVIARVGGYVRNWIVIDLVPGSVGRYRIAGYNGVGYGPWTDPIEVVQDTAMGEFQVLPAVAVTPEPLPVPGPGVAAVADDGFFSRIPGGLWTVLGAALVLAVLVWLLLRRVPLSHGASVQDDGALPGQSGVLLVPAFRVPGERGDSGGQGDGVGDDRPAVVVDDGDEDPDDLRRRLAELLGVSDDDAGLVDRGEGSGSDGGDAASGSGR